VYVSAFPVTCFRIEGTPHCLGTYLEMRVQLSSWNLATGRRRPLSWRARPHKNDRARSEVIRRLPLLKYRDTRFVPWNWPKALEIAI